MKKNRGGHGRGGGGGRGSFAGRQRGHGGGFDAQKRRLFTRLMKDEDAVMRDDYQARRFIEGMETFESKAELLAKLQDEREHGMRRIRDLLSFINSCDDVEALLIPVLKLVMCEETNRPTYRTLRDQVLLAIFNVPGLMDVLEEHNVVETVAEDSAKQICLFLRALTKPFIEPRQSRAVRCMARALRDRGDVEEARVLCSCLLIQQEGEAASVANVENRTRNEPRRRNVACWVSDMEPPGDRHDNDHRNYRGIRIVPTVEELNSQQKP